MLLWLQSYLLALVWYLCGFINILWSMIQCWDFGPIFRKWSEILTFPPNWSELGILFHEKLEKLTFHMKLASIFALKLRGTNPPMGCITTSLVTITFSVQI